MTINESIIRSAVWSAYGDALGFVTELADQKSLQHRTGKKTTVHELINWKRKIGGYSGASVELPAGIYSDDTQLRLATCRCINSNGYFDVEAFAKVELPVWLSYCLGAGRGTKAAAANLIKNDCTWFSNFYKDKNLNYFQSGGNGAVMRIQPHVWANLSLDVEGILLDVFRNTICTHGHTRGILGACFHALFLLHTINHQLVPDIDDWKRITSNLIILPDIIADDMQISTFWKPTWEAGSAISFEESVKKTIQEILEDIRQLEMIYDSSGDPHQQYLTALDSLGGFDPKQRGSGTKTALLASFLSLLFRNSPQEAMVLSANQLGSDTDTIATVAGAIIGAISSNMPNEKLIDQKYIEKEALRIGSLNQGTTNYEFTYPDLMDWKAPKRLSDAVESFKNGYLIKGLGLSRSIGKPPIVGKNNSLRWEWLQTSFGQTCLIRVKDKPSEADCNTTVIGYVRFSELQNKKTETQQNLITTYTDTAKNHKSEDEYCNSKRSDIESLSTRTINKGLQAYDIGNDIRMMLDEERTIEEIIGYTAIIARACKTMKGR